MEFRTAIKPVENKGVVTHDCALMMLGSCFSDNIGGRMREAMMSVDVNPFGTLYNPVSISNAVERIISARPMDESELFLANGVWNSFDFHSRFSSEDKAAALDRMNRRLAAAHEHLARCRVLCVTLGTAVVYRHQELARVVANCHKLPSARFERRMLPADEVTKVLTALVESALAYNPDLHIIFTVSPIRHISDGLQQSQLSKSILRVAVAEAVSANPHACDYFPAYEVMMDDLRDYRFYAADMVHPSDVAIEYIWNTFQAAYFDDRTAQAVARCERVSKRINHRIMTDNAEVAERFKAETADVVKNLLKEYPYLENLSLIKKYL